MKFVANGMRNAVANDQKYVILKISSFTACLYFLSVFDPFSILYISL